MDDPARAVGGTVNTRDLRRDEKLYTQSDFDDLTAHHLDRLAHARQLADARIEALVARSRWVLASERLPALEERVLVQCKDGTHEVARLTYDLGYDDGGDPPETLVVWSINSLDGLPLEPESDVIAWMPLPVPWVAP